MKKKKMLRIWFIISEINHYKLALYLKEKLSRFETENNVKIQIEFVTWERILTALIDAFKNDTAPDVLQIGTSWVRTFVHMGYLDQVPKSIDIEPSINNGINEICQIEERCYAVPWVVDTVIMAARRDYMDELNISKDDVKTLEGLKRTVQELMERKKKNEDVPKPLSVALKIENDTLQRFFSLLWSHGWEFPDLNKVPEKIIADSCVIDTIKYFASLKITCDNPEEIDRHPYQFNEDFYNRGRSVFYIGSWYGIVNNLNNGQSDNEFCVLPFPAADNKSCSYGGGSALAVSSKSKHKEKAWKLVEYLLREDIIKRVDIGNVPAFDDDFWQKRFEDKQIKLMYDQTVNSKIYPSHPAWISIENEIINGIGPILLNLVKKRKAEFEEKDYSHLKMADQKIKKILKMCWEMK